MVSINTKNSLIFIRMNIFILNINKNKCENF